MMTDLWMIALFFGLPAAMMIYSVWGTIRFGSDIEPLESPENWGSQDIDLRTKQ